MLLDKMLMCGKGFAAGVLLAAGVAHADVTRYDGSDASDVAAWNAAVANGLSVAAGDTVAITNGTFTHPAKAPSFGNDSVFRVEQDATLFATNDNAGFYISSERAQILLQGGMISNCVNNKTAFFGSAAKNSRIALSQGAQWLMPAASGAYFRLSGEGNCLETVEDSTLYCNSPKEPMIMRNTFHNATGCRFVVSNATYVAMGVAFGNTFKHESEYGATYIGYSVCNTVLLHNATCNVYNSSHYGVVMGSYDSTQKNKSTNDVMIVSGDATHTTDIRGLNIGGFGDVFRLEGTKLKVAGWDNWGVRLFGVSNRLELVGGSLDTPKIRVAGEGCLAEVGPLMTVDSPIILGEMAARSRGSTYRVRGTSSGTVSVVGFGNTAEVDGGTQSGAITLSGTNSTLRLANGGTVGTVNWGEGTICAATAETVTFDGNLNVSKFDETSTNTFAGVDGSKIVVSGALSIADDPIIEIATGYVRFDAALPTGQKVIVRAGATLELTQSDWEDLALTLDEGSHFIAPVVVPYDPATDTTTPVAIPAALQPTPEDPLAVRLSVPVPLPKDAASLPVVTFDASEDLDVSCFKDATEKTYGLPRTSFEIREEGGTKTVYLNVRPTVVSVKNFENALNINGSADTWSNGKAAAAGSDYLLTNGVASIGEKTTFKGDSLTIAPTASIGMRSTTHYLKTATGEKVVIYPKVGTIQSWNGRDMVIEGDLDLPGNYGDADYFDIYLKYGEWNTYHGTLRLDATVTGSGTLRVSGVQNGRSMNGIKGDLSGYTGQIRVYGNGSTFANAMHARIWEQRNLGGALPQFEDEALSVSTYGTLRPMQDITLTNGLNRGMYFDVGGFDCPTGVTLTTHWPLKLKTRLGKVGAGTLWLGGAVTHAGTTKALQVDEGAIGFLRDDAASDFNAVFSNATEIVLSASAGLENGLTGTLTVKDASAGVAGCVRVSVDPTTLPAKKGAVRAVICTLPSSVDATGFFELVRPRGYCRPALKTESVTLGGVACTRYVFTADPTGVLILCR